MKTRIAMSVLALALWGWLARSLFTPVTNLAETQVAVATVNGGDAAFVAQQALQETARVSSVVYSLALIGLLLFIWLPVLKKWWATDPIINSAA